MSFTFVAIPEIKNDNNQKKKKKKKKKKIKALKSQWDVQNKQCFWSGLLEPTITSDPLYSL